MFLPDGSKSSMLYKLTMSEDAYLKESVRPDSVLKDPLVEGVYETNIDTVQNAILDLGLACTLDDSRPGLLGRGLESGFDLKWLIPCGASNRGEYLDSSTFYYIHVLHMSFGGSQIIAIVPTWSSTAHVLVFGSSAQGPLYPILASYTLPNFLIVKKDRILVRICLNTLKQLILKNLVSLVLGVCVPMLEKFWKACKVNTPSRLSLFFNHPHQSESRV